MAWTMLLLAGLFEIVWAIRLKDTDGFSRLRPTVATLVAMILSMGLIGLAVRSLPVDTADAAWTGIGAAGTVILGILLLRESAHPGRLACVGLILAGIVGLKLLTPS
ncbi:MAG: quaternary ammonium compound efflux SMR transporter SugE [bacterium]|jgi:quaternary ammonium compound-resistance protein SugE|nr:quaternary ammonium compound efflux SMR transporter SugE [bacterium]